MSYLSAEIDLAYSTAQANWTFFALDDHEI